MPDLSFYTGAYTGQQIDQRLGNMIVNVSGSISNENKQVNNSKILANHVVLRYYLNNPYVQISNWAFTCYDGYVTITGDIAGTTSITMTLGLT